MERIGAGSGNGGGEAAGVPPLMTVEQNLNTKFMEAYERVRLVMEGKGDRSKMVSVWGGVGSLGIVGYWYVCGCGIRV